MSHAFAHRNEMADRYPSAHFAWERYAAAMWPQEACALVLADDTLQPLVNRHPDPTNHFETEDYDERLPIVGFLHSHTMKPDKDGRVDQEHLCPSEADMRAQIACDFPWGISQTDGNATTEPIWWGDQLKPLPLVGRMFVSGIWDCFSGIRDVHNVCLDIKFQDFPREDNWWEIKGEEGERKLNMYMDGFEEAGFRRVEREGLQLIPGDCFICKVRSPVPNHAGIFLGDGGLIFHHVSGFLSMRTPAVRWGPKMDFIVRHKDLPDDAVQSIAIEEPAS